MCGICGFVDLSSNLTGEDLGATVESMTNTLDHRGPDDQGTWVDKARRVALGHRRLSVIDLSSAGHQPMTSHDGRYVVAYNGEIYNHRALRSELETEGYAFRGHSDTEVMLEAFSSWGIKKTLERLNGMFALVLWDRRERILHLARDRLGKKPLYYGWMGTTFLFGSELKALRAHPSFRSDIDRSVLALYLRHNYIPSPYSIYQNVSKLPPACSLSFRPIQPGQIPAPKEYWSARTAAKSGLAHPLDGSESDAVDALEIILSDAVRVRMESDVPLGALLSGGVDSSLVVALMQRHADQPTRTFSIGYREGHYNEAIHAKRVAQHLGTDHTELYVSAQEATEVIPKLPSLYDEPFADASQIPTFLISQLARQAVTVSLSGDGGDELFGGYNRYFWAHNIWRYTGWLPQLLRKRLAAVFRVLSPLQWNRLFQASERMLPSSLNQHMPGDKLYKLADVLDSRNSAEVYERLVSLWRCPERVVKNAREPKTAITKPEQSLQFDQFLNRMMYLDLVTYLPDDLLVKVDRASMGVSLEVRSPLLDYRVVEFAWRVPLSMKIHGNRGKHPLRELLYRFVPKPLIDRPKMGFAVPIDKWLRGPLREWAETLLDRHRLENEGFFEPQEVLKKWREHQYGERNWQYQLWTVLMFQAWHAEHGG